MSLPSKSDSKGNVCRERSAGSVGALKIEHLYKPTCYWLGGCVLQRMWVTLLHCIKSCGRAKNNMTRLSGFDFIEQINSIHEYSLRIVQFNLYLTVRSARTGLKNIPKCGSCNFWPTNTLLLPKATLFPEKLHKTCSPRCNGLCIFK